MAFLCTFSGMTIALLVWVTLYTLTVNSDNPLLLATASYLEAFSVTGQCVFVILAHMFHTVGDFGTFAADRVLVRDATGVAG